MSPELLLGAVLAAAVVVFVSLPFLRMREPPEAAAPPDAELAAAEARHRVLAELKELEFDHRTGKISDDDYRALVGPLRRDAAALLPRKATKTSEQQRLSDHSVPSDRLPR